MFLESCDEEVVDADGRKWICRNQLDYLTDPFGRLMVDFIGRFERFQQDFNVVPQKALGRPLMLQQINKSFHRHYSDCYSPALAEKVRARFKRDIEAFGYALDSDSSSRDIAQTG